MPRLLLILLLVVTGLNPPALARGQDAQSRDAALALITRLPEQVDVVGLVPSGEAYLRDAQGYGGADALAMTAGTLEQLLALWKPLAGALEMPAERAMVALMGGAVVLAGDVGPDLDGLSAWALLTTVTPDTERLITARLTLFPREVIAGRPALSLESGRYVLALRRVEVAPGAPAPDRSVQLFLSPSTPKGIALLSGLLAATAGAPAPEGVTFADTAPALASLRSLPAGWAGMLIRDDPGTDADPEHWGWGTHRAISFHGSMELGSISGIVRDRRLQSARQHLRAFSIEPLAPWLGGAAMSALLVECPNLDAELRPWLLAILPELPGRHDPSSSARVSVWSASPRADGQPGLCVRIAAQCAAGKDSAQDYDTLLSRIGTRIETLASGRSAGGWDQINGLAALAPMAKRTVELAIPDRGYGAALLGHPVAMTWGLRRAPDGSRLGTEHDGWMLAQLGGPGDEPLAVPLAAPGGAPEPARRWVSRLSIRIDALTRALPTIMPMLTERPLLAMQMPRENAQAVADSLAMTREITWESWLDEQSPDTARFEMVMRIDPEKAKQVQARWIAQRAKGDAPKIQAP